MNVLALLALLIPTAAAVLEPAKPPPLTAKYLTLGGEIFCSRGAVCDVSGMDVLSGGPSAVMRDLGSKLSEVQVNVRDYGPKGRTCINGANGSDDTAAIANAVNAVIALGGSRGGSVHVSGACVFSSAIAIPAGKAVSFVGDGSGASILRQTNPAADGIVFDNTTNGPYLTQGQSVRKLTVEAGAGLVAGSFFGQGSTGRGIVYIHGNDNAGVRDVSINGFKTGLALLGSFNTLHTSFRVMFGSGDSILIDKAPDGTVGAGNRMQQIKLSNNGFSSDNTASVGLRIRASGGEYLTNIDATSFNIGLKVDPRAGDQVAYLFFDTFLCDTSTGDGAVFDGSGGNIISAAGSMFWSSFSGGSGLVTKGVNLHGLRLANPRMRENGQFGWDHQGGDGIELTTPEIHSNGRGSAVGTYSGVRIHDGATEPKSFAIIGGSIGNAESNVALQGEAIRFLGAASNFRIQGVDMTGSSGGKGAISMPDEKRLTAFKMLGNLPGSTYFLNASERQAVSFGGYVATGATAYFEPVGPVPGVQTAPFFVPKPTLIGMIVVSVNAAPGSGQTFTYRLFVNGTPVGTSGVISGASSFQVTLYPGIAINQGDNYELQVVGSSGAAAALHRGYVQLDP